MKTTILFATILTLSHAVLFAQPYEWAQVHAPDLPEYDLLDLHAFGDTLIAVGYKSDGVANIFKSVILTSTDDGETWAEEYLDGRFFKTIDFNEDGTGYMGGFGVGGGGFIMRSTDRGLTWQNHFDDFQHGGITEVQFVNAQQGYASGYGDMQFFNPIFYSTEDGGDTWNVRSQNTASFTTYDQVSVFDQEMYSLSSVYFSGSVLGKDLSYSSDGGATWILIHENDENLGGMAWLDVTTGYLITAVGSIQKSTDGGVNWTEVHNTGGDALFDIYLENGQDGYAVGAGGLLLKTTDDGASWAAENSGTDRNLARVLVQDGRTYALGQDGIILRWQQPGTGGGDGGSGDPVDPIDWPIGITSVQAEDIGFSVYPNPIVGQNFVVELNAGAEVETLEMTLYDPLGKPVFQTKPSVGKNEITLPTTASGVYHLRLTNQGHTIDHRVLLKN